MTGPVATATRPRRAAPAARARARRRTRRRRRAVLGAGLLAAGVLALLALAPLFEQAVQEIRLPLRHEDIIRQQAAEERLDPALVAGVIYVESRFADRTSPAGARGLMQITPDTAAFIARRSGGTRFVPDDLATPQVNISYGTYYLRYLLGRFDGDEMLATAAYNAGASRVEGWLAEAARAGREFRAEDIPYPETRAYVGRVAEARDSYRRTYERELGL